MPRPKNRSRTRRIIWITALVLAMLPLTLAVRLTWNTTVPPSARGDGGFRWGRLRIDVICGFLLVTVQKPSPSTAEREAWIWTTTGALKTSREEALRLYDQDMKAAELLDRIALQSSLWTAVAQGQGTLAGRVSAPPRYRGVYVRRWLAIAVLAGCTLLLTLPALAAALATLQRRARPRRGCCATCGYNLYGSPGPVCPECGEPNTPFQ